MTSWKNSVDFLGIMFKNWKKLPKMFNFKSLTFWMNSILLQETFLQIS